jgi:hypothetical protein
MLVTKVSLENSERFLKQIGKILFRLLSWGQLCDTVLQQKYDINNTIVLLNSNISAVLTTYTMKISWIDSKRNFISTNNN